MRYDLSGSREAPVLLMFPGSFGSARMMQGYTDLLKEKCCVIAVPLSGRSESCRPGFSII